MDIIGHAVLMYKDLDAGCVPYRWSKFHIIDLLLNNETVCIAITTNTYNKCLTPDGLLALTKSVISTGEDKWEDLEHTFNELTSGDLSGGYGCAALFHLMSSSMAKMGDDWVIIDSDCEEHVLVVAEPWTIMEGYVEELTDLTSNDVKTLDDVEYNFKDTVSKRKVCFVTRFFKWLFNT